MMHICLLAHKKTNRRLSTRKAANNCRLFSTTKTPAVMMSCWEGEIAFSFVNYVGLSCMLKFCQELVFSYVFGLGSDICGKWPVRFLALFV